jgi:hypothetical protein
VALAAVSERWLQDLHLWQAVPMVEALLALLRREAPTLMATLDTGEVPEGDWKATVAALIHQARAQILDPAP